MSDDPRISGQNAAAILSILRRGEECAQQLLEENQSLRGQIRALEQGLPSAELDPGDWEQKGLELEHRLEELEAEKRQILERVEAVELENQQFAGRYMEIEEENNNLANLYLASHQLHSTLDPGDVLKVVIEIVIKLIGAEVFCIYVVDERDAYLEPVAAEGAKLSTFSRVPVGSGPIGAAVVSGEVATGGSPSPGGTDSEAAPAVAVIPLRVQDRPVGVIAIHRLRQRRDDFSSLDHEHFTLLAAHAATAIFAARLHAQSERKLNTIRGFIDLLTK